MTLVPKSDPQGYVIGDNLNKATYKQFFATDIKQMKKGPLVKNEAMWAKRLEEKHAARDQLMDKLRKQENFEGNWKIKFFTKIDKIQI